MFEKVVLVTRKTRLADLVVRFNTKKQAKFYVERSGQDFTGFEAEDETYRRAVDALRAQLDVGLPVQQVDRSLVPTFLFTGKEVVVAVGQDGLVANVAKYVGSQPLVGVNPDPERFDGVLLPFLPAKARSAVQRTLDGRANVRQVQLAEARLQDGQRLLAFNDLFIGARTHVSARYQVRYGGQEEAQSSSGVLVSTGAGSSGWLSSVFALARGLTQKTGGVPGQPWTLGWRTRGWPSSCANPSSAATPARASSAASSPPGTSWCSNRGCPRAASSSATAWRRTSSPSALAPPRASGRPNSGPVWSSHETRHPM